MERHRGDDGAGEESELQGDRRWEFEKRAAADLRRREVRLRPALRAAILLAVSLSYLSYVFDIFHDRFWTAGLGDWIDPYFINYLLEHWYHAVTTFSDPFSPPMFYPAQNTLGYSHGLILYAPFYVPVRVFVHPFQAYSLALFIVIESGIVCLYVIFRRFLKLSFVESLLLTALFFTSPNVINRTVGIWSQRASVFLIPPILLSILISFHQSPGRARLILAGLSGGVATLLFAHDFYSAYFAFVFAALFFTAFAFVDGGVSGAARPVISPAQRIVQTMTAVVAIVAGLWSVYVWTSGGVRMRVLGIRILSQDWRRPALLCLLCVTALVWLRGVPTIRRDLKRWISRGSFVSSPWVRALAVGAIAGLAVFLWAYLPAYREHPRFPEQDLLSQIRVRTWHGWTRALRDLNTYDTTRSFKLVGLAGILACVPWIKVDRETRWYVLWAVVTSLIVFLMPVQIGGFSIWLSFFRHVPGFSVIRDPTRIIYLYELAFILAAALYLTRFRTRPAYRACICLLLAYFLATDHRVDKFSYQRPRDVFRRWVEAPIDVDPACRSFFIKAASEEYMSRFDQMWALYAGDSMFIALEHGLPTLNGYSAWHPERWELMRPSEPTYRGRVTTWIHDNSLQGVCELDIEARTMKLASVN